MLQQIGELEDKGEDVGLLRMCKINSGRFGVAWGRTVRVLTAVEVREGWRGEVEVWDLGVER